MTTSRAHAAFDTLAKRILDERWEAYPHEASAVGLHEYDGRLPALSAEAIAARVGQLRESAAHLAALDSASLTDRQRFDREVLIAGVDGELFELTEWRAFRRNPMALMGPIEVTSYMDRSYAPPQERAASLAQALRQAPAYLEALAALLEPPFAEPVLRQSIDSYQGVAGFYRDEVIAFVRLHGGASGEELAGVVERAADAVDALVQRLRTHEPAGDFAMGPDLYAKMLRHGEMVELSLAEIEAAGERELRRNLDVAGSAAKEIVGSGNVAEAMAVIAKRHPTAEGLLDDARAMLEEIRAYTIDQGIASVVSEVRAEVKETPAFMRWAFAAMNSPGPFETVATEAFYYVTPVDDRWTAAQAEEWLSNFNYPTLRIISIHEVYPGHYVHFLRNGGAPSDVVKVFGAYSFWEGWAHYCEEMFLEAGYGVGDPELRLAMAQEALVRVCRLLCSLRMHTQGMPLADAARFFQDNAFMAELPASQEALRGTFDPGYLNYTLGKMMIYKLRTDWRAQQGAAYSLGAFHDELLSHGGPPLPLLRRTMLRNDDGRIL